jgi:hypothetical protein
VETAGRSWKAATTITGMTTIMIMIIITTITTTTITITGMICIMAKARRAFRCRA